MYFSPRPHSAPQGASSAQQRGPSRKTLAGMAGARDAMASTTASLGVAATAHPAATEAAAEILRAGGNAVDAAVAAAWAIGVCEPGNSGLGGQSIVTLRLASGEILVLDGHSRAPAAACVETITRQQQTIGHRATTVPTTPMVLETARRRYGRLSLAKVLAPAIRLALEGFAVTTLHRKQLKWCLNSLAKSPSASSLLLRRGELYDVGETFRQPALAATLARLASAGVDDFYNGQLARMIVLDQQRNDGVMTAADLAAVESPVPRQPISITYRGHKVVTAAPPAGGLQLLVGLKLLERLLSEESIGESEWYEMLGETTHGIFRQREQSGLASDEHTAQHCCDLLGDERIESLANEILTTPLPGENGVASGQFAVIGDDEEEPGETTHLCTADAQGNVVSLTQSIQSLFGARAACSPCGFLYNNYLVTCPRDDHPHRLRGGCRPRSNSAPTLILPAAGKPGDRLANSIMAVGAAGSRRTTSALLHTIAGVVQRGMSLEDAVAAPRFHVKLSRNAWLESAPETEVLVPRLQQRFRSIKLRGRFSYAMGCVQAIQTNFTTSVGAADPRREGTGEAIAKN